MPAPKRGELIRLLGKKNCALPKNDSGKLVSIEVGKITSEGLGEVQEMIDIICDFAVGLSRQLYGLTIATERADHRMMETWHPLGVVGIISAFNFPVCRLGLECSARHRLRQCHRLEALRENTTDRTRDPGHLRESAEAFRR